MRFDILPSKKQFYMYTSIDSHTSIGLYHEMIIRDYGTPP